MVEMKMELELERQRKVDLPLELRLVTARIMAGCFFFWREGGRGGELSCFFSKGRRRGAGMELTNGMIRRLFSICSRVIPRE